MNEEILKSEIVAATIFGKGVSHQQFLVRTISYRVPITTLARVDAMAQQAGKSRNTMMNMLLDVGINDVYAHFNQEEIEELQSRESLAFQALDHGSNETAGE